MEVPKYHSPEIDTYVDAVSRAIGAKRVQLAAVLSDVPPETEALATELEALTGRWNPVEFYTASNFRAERDAFLAARANGEAYVPSFRYPRAAAFDAAGSRAKLSELRARAMGLPDASDRDRLARITLVAKIDDDLATCDLCEGMATGNDALVKRGCAAKYPGLDDDLLRCAETLYRDIAGAADEGRVPHLLSEGDASYLEKLTLSSQEEADAYRWALREYGLLREDGDRDGEGFRVVVDPGVTGLDVRDKSADGPTVFVPEHRIEPLTAMEVFALIAHEIEGHACQATNGHKLFRLGGGGLRKDDETLYEGLALRNEYRAVEKYFGKPRYDIDGATLYVFAATMAAEGKAFAEIFEDQLARCLELSRSPASSLHGKSADFCRKEAFRVAYRVLRGHTDASNGEAFAMTKDLAYLRGWLMDQQLVENGLGHVNEAAIMSAKGLQSLARMDISPEDIPVKFKDVAPRFLDMLLAKRPKGD